MCDAARAASRAREPRRRVAHAQPCVAAGRLSAAVGLLPLTHDPTPPRHNDTVHPSAITKAKAVAGSWTRSPECEMMRRISAGVAPPALTRAARSTASFASLAPYRERGGDGGRWAPAGRAGRRRCTLAQNRSWPRTARIALDRVVDRDREVVAGRRCMPRHVAPACGAGPPPFRSRRSGRNRFRSRPIDRSRPMRPACRDAAHRVRPQPYVRPVAPSTARAHVLGQRDAVGIARQGPTRLALRPRAGRSPPGSRSSG